MSLHSEEKSKQTFQYGNKTIKYDLIKSKRRKTCEVIVDKDEITIRVPFDKHIKEVESILKDKIKWISQKQKEIQDENPEIAGPPFDNNSTIPYLGKNYPFEIKHNENTVKEKIEFDSDKFIMYLNPDSKEDEQKEKLKSIYRDWLVLQANQKFKEKVNQYGRVIDATPKRIVTKNLKNRWGSVTKNETINLNVNLMKAPEDIIDYIIIHELCHFKIKGHSYIFWDYLKQFVPEYKQKVEWLRRNADNLLN